MIQHHVKNFTVQVSAEIGFHELRSELIKNDQFIPLGPYSLPFKVNEIIEYNLIGGYVEDYGQVKDWIINAVISTSEGEIETGANVVKNVSGYNLTRFIVGSRGKFGKLNKVCLRTLPIHKNYHAESCQISGGYRLVVLPESVLQFEQFLENKNVKFQSFIKMGIIDCEIKSNTIFSEINDKILKLYKLINGIPNLLNQDQSLNSEKLLTKLNE